jgi:urea transporter
MKRHSGKSLSLQVEGFLNSYPQIFFSDHRILAYLLLLVSFIDPWAGLSGALAVVVSNLTAQSMGFSSWYIRKGYYGYNSLLVGLGFGLTFQPGFAFYLLLVVAALMTFFFTVALQGILYKYALPYLSIPFILGLWMVLLASGQFTALGLSEWGIYTLNELFALGGKSLIDLVDACDGLITSPGLRTWLFSLGAIFFQYNLLAGLLIAIGLLLWSRIAFTLSLAGFYLAWLFYQITGADISALGYSYIGFNYILTSIALGGFFIIPSRWSYLWLLWLLPLVIVMTVSLQQLFALFRLGVYALPFNIVVLTFLYVLKIRINPGQRLTETKVQLFTPEKNLYYHHTAGNRFFLPGWQPVSLPVMGEWTVSQGVHGEHTHQGEWAHAWDLVITGNDGAEFRGEGLTPRDYHCYEKPVVAPADGIIADLIDGIPDNPIGDNNVRQNWGNSIVIRHGEHLFSQVSHLKPGSLKVKKGDPVKRGDLIALCGNSGRSPYPHLHFQIQATPHIGSKTLDYPLSDFLLNQEGRLTLKTHAYPHLHEKITSLRNHPLFEKAFHFLPGKKMAFEVTGNTPDWLMGTHLWEIITDEYNSSYFKCSRTGAMAYFYNNGNIHWFLNFLGTRKSLLYYFYLGFYKVVTGYYQDLTIRDALPVDKLFTPQQLFLQDFVAPFRIYKKGEYTLTFQTLDDDLYASSVVLEAVVTRGRREMQFHILLKGSAIAEFSYKDHQYDFKAVCTGS